MGHLRTLGTISLQQGIQDPRGGQEACTASTDTNARPNLLSRPEKEDPLVWAATWDNMGHLRTLGTLRGSRLAVDPQSRERRRV